ncbi:MAG: gamma-glutamyltransferase, partial [Rhodothermia bacterium]|nr:gamma-glutamyltransferase [Rhodothermia bacterium]
MSTVTMKWITCIVLPVAIAATPVSAQSGWSPVPARHGMVATSHYLGTEVGVQTMREHGGNAVDAAVAVAFALAVAYPSAGNIGGGGFLVYHGADGDVTSFNFREKAPLASTTRMFLDEQGEVWANSNHDGPLAVGVPGTVAGLALAHQRLGSLPWSDLLEPAVELAENGFPVDWNLFRFLEWVEEHRVEFPSTARVFLDSLQKAPQPGSLLRQPDLAATLRRIQQAGHDGFYRGETARLFASFMRENGGLITEEDLGQYEAVEQPPIHGTYRGLDVYAMAPPSSGGIVLTQMLNILEGFDLGRIGHNSAMYLHLLTEAMRRAYAGRALHLGDPAFNPDMPVDRLTSKVYADSLRSTISMFRASISDSAAFNEGYDSPETTHISIVDAAGNAVSLTYTLEQSYGSKIVVDGAGFLLNNEMGDFNAVPGLTNSRGRIGTVPNLIEPGKRMLSNMTPTIVAEDGLPLLVIGTPGGRTIQNTVLQVVLNVIDHGMNIAEAIHVGRFHHQWLPDTTYVERRAISSDTWRLYEMMGHNPRYRTSRGRPSNQGQAMGVFLDRDQGL